MQLIYYGGLPDSRIAGDQCQLWRAALNDTVEGGEQRPDFALTSIQFLRNQKAIGLVMFSQREGMNVTLTIPVLQTTAKVSLHAGCRLITLFRSLANHLPNDSRHPNPPPL